MVYSRRHVLGLVGGGIVVAAGVPTAVGVSIATRSPDRALAPWAQAGGDEEIRRFALSYAILAPNPHNRQPWIVDLREPGAAVLWRDTAKNLPHTDPYDRQLTIGMGCFCELMALAAAARGYRVDFTFFPDGDGGPVAQCAFIDGGGAPDPLFAHVLNRRSCKEPFQDRRVPDDRVAALKPLADIHTDPVAVDRIKALTWRAFLIEMKTPRTYKESVDLMRLGKAEIEANPDGIDLGGGLVEVLIASGVMTRAALLDPASKSYAQGIALYDEMLHATPAYASLVTAGNSRLDQIAAGRRWLRLNLATTGMGLALHPVSQALQEYPEMAGQYEEARRLLAPEGGTVQMLGRLGFGPNVGRSPRWPLEAKIV